MWSGFYPDEEVRAAAPPASRASRKIPPPMAGMMAPKLTVFLVVVTYGGLVVGVV